MRKRSKPTTLPLGTISEGTLRPEDLIPAYLSALDEIRLSKAERMLVRGLAKDVDTPQDDRKHSVYRDDIVDELTNILEAHCPDYTYFGSLEGDGACFGIWPQPFDEITDDIDVSHVNAGDPFPTDLPFVLSVTDHGNATLYRRAGKRWIEVWSVV